MNSGGSAAHPEIEKEEAKGQFEAGERPPTAQACEAGETVVSRETITTPHQARA